MGTNELKDANKKAKENNTKTETAPVTFPLYNDLDESLGTRDIIK